MNIFKTAIGKAVLFILTVFFTMTACAGIAGVALCYEYDIYNSESADVINAVIEAHDTAWMENMAEALIGRAKAFDPAARVYLEDDYAYTLTYYGEVISFGTPYGYSYINADEIGYRVYELGYNTARTFADGAYEITIWTYDNTMTYEVDTKVIGIAAEYKNYWHYLAVGGAVMTLLCFVGLMCVTARRNGHTEPVPGALNVIPFDLELVAIAGIVSVICVACNEILNNSEAFSADIVIFTVVATAVLVSGFFCGLCMELVARIKLKNLFSNTVIGAIFRFVGKIFKKIGAAIGTFFKNLPFIWVGVLAVSILTLFELFGIVIIWEQDNLLIVWFLEKIVLIPVLFYFFICMHRLHVGSKAIAAGELSYKTDTSHMILHFKEHGENLNKMSEGMSRAVNEKLKSERMKTELITNVSHDIKTPLTSIINYSDLISKEECTNEKITQYAEVISRQSGRLKRLLEDLLELSKSATGNVTVNLEQCDAGILLEQATGEYEEKLSKAGLVPVVTIPNESIYINADRRLLWRVFDNLLSNMSKYALAGTRVYFNLSKENNKAVFRFKNTSRDMLNITAEELKARFVRGDASRNTEGNGLGLSIAENLVNNQGGKLDIFIDADLFVATISFECIEVTEEKANPETVNELNA